MLWLLAAALGLLAVFGAVLALRVGTLLAQVEFLGHRVRELSARLDATERDATGALARAEAAETVLLDKGLADEEDLEAARRRGDEDPPADVHGDGELH